MHTIIRQIIDRDCYVGMSNRAVISHVITKLKNKRRGFFAMCRADRRMFMRHCIAIHATNRALYRRVTAGRF
jgi:hypothetical protein